VSQRDQTPSPLPAPLLRLAGVAKRFGGVRALDGVAFDLRAGEVHALLGENGAGKSTLIKILAGVHAPDAGTIEVDGQLVSIRGVADADRLGIRVIHQELSLAPNLTVSENIYLGAEPTALGLLSRRRMNDAARGLIAALGLEELRDAVRMPVRELSVAHAQLVEIARALSRRARVLILDEPTSSLSEAETEALFVTLERLKSQGVGIIYISHRLEEIARLADRITVLRDGRSVGTQDAAGLDRRELVRWMVGRDIADYFHRPPPPPPPAPGEQPALEVRDLRNAKVRGVSLTVRRGEILGVAGLVGSGRSELVRAIFGVDPLDAGQVLLDGQPVSIGRPRDALDAGVVLVPEDRKLQGLVMTNSVAFNLALPWTHRWNPSFMPNRRARAAIVDRAIKGFGIKVSDPEQRVGGLSGGNQQKVLVGRWMEERPKVLILDEPTRGVDVGAREEMFTALARLVGEGMAVLMISSDLAEVMNMSHRLALYREGRIIDTVDPTRVTAEDVMHRLTGGGDGGPPNMLGATASAGR
jgi:ABC-type sugar transport system ATPase subunit